MLAAISNTSPLLYLHRIEALDWLPKLFTEIWTPPVVLRELQEGEQRNYDVPDPADYPWLRVVAPRAIPSEWLAQDLGAGELAVLSLGLEYPNRIILLDDKLARCVGNAQSIVGSKSARSC